MAMPAHNCNPGGPAGLVIGALMDVPGKCSQLGLQSRCKNLGEIMSLSLVRFVPNGKPKWLTLICSPLHLNNNPGVS